MNKEPYVLIRDDDCHWFLIPLAVRLEFETLRDWGETGKIEKRFGQYSIDNPYKLVILDWEK